MARLLVHVEGQTEEEFVNDVLRAHLTDLGYSQVSARRLGNARSQSRRLGIKGWPSVRVDIVNHLNQDPGCLSTTMVDLYGLPQSGERKWPGRAEAATLQGEQKALFVEHALLNDIVQRSGPTFNSKRFIPFVILHEFEALLFSDCTAFSRGIHRPDLETDLRRIRSQFATPEDINDSPETAPSKRVDRLMDGHYKKPLLSVLAALEVGITSIRQECPHFNRWLDQLESLGQQLP